MADGEIFYLGWKHNLITGAKLALEIPPAEKATLEQLAYAATEAIGIRFCSVDIIQVADNRYKVLEINSGVLMQKMILLLDNGYQIAKAFYKAAILEMFGEHKQ